MKQKQDQVQQPEERLKLRIVSPEEVAGLPNKSTSPQRNRSRLAEQLSRYCDQIDQEIEKILRL